MTQRANDNLTSTQEHALRVFAKLCDRQNTPPTVRQFAAALGVSKTAAYEVMRRLREKGRLGTAKVVTEVRLKVTAKGLKDL